MRYLLALMGTITVTLCLGQIPLKRTYVNDFPEQFSYTADIPTSRQVNDPIILPLIFHIVHHRDSIPPSLDEIQQQIASTNADFRGITFANRSRTGSYDNRAADTQIEFCAQYYSEQIKNTVLYVPTDTTVFSSFDNVKYSASGGSDAIDAAHYINIWVCDLDQVSGGTTYSPKYILPDGILIDKDFFGTGTYPYDKGKTLTHLLGNYLGLYDIWGTEPCTDDGVQDTPIHNAPNETMRFLDETHISTCPGFVEEMYQNFMDNTADSLLYMFTKGQKNRMHAFLQDTTLRGTLYQLSTCGYVDARTITSEQAASPETFYTLYPNPTNDLLYVQINSQKTSSLEISITNLLGQTMYNASWQVSPGNQLFEVQTNSWPSGQYFLTAVQQAVPVSFSFIKL